MADTVHRGYALPDPARTVKAEFWNFALVTLPAIDLDIHSLFVALDGKAATGHGHAIADITGLQTALNGKMAADVEFTFAGLGDVVGMDVAPDGYVPVKVGSQIIMQSAASTLGAHGHSISQVTGLQAALDSKAPASGIADPWAFQPIGVPIPLQDNIAGVAAPPTDKSYRYIKLTASDAYNTGVLTSESISGSAPNLTATAVVNLTGSPLNGQTVALINTDRRFLRAGSPGTKQQSQNLSHTHTGEAESDGSHEHTGTATSAGAHAHNVPTKAGETTSGINTGYVGAEKNSGAGATYNTPTASSGNHTHPLDINTAGAHTHPLDIDADGGTEARPANIGETFYMRIK